MNAGSCRTIQSLRRKCSGRWLISGGNGNGSTSSAEASRISRKPLHRRFRSLDMSCRCQTVKIGCLPGLKAGFGVASGRPRGPTCGSRFPRRWSRCARFIRCIARREDDTDCRRNRFRSSEVFFGMSCRKIWDLWSWGVTRKNRLSRRSFFILVTKPFINSAPPKPRSIDYAGTT